MIPFIPDDPGVEDATISRQALGYVLAAFSGGIVGGLLVGLFTWLLS